MPNQLLEKIIGNAPRTTATIQNQHDKKRTVEPELVITRVPRMIRPSAKAWITRQVLWNACLILAALTVFLGHRGYTTWNQLIAHGIVTQATVASIANTEADAENSELRVEYRFRTDVGSVSFERLIERQWGAKRNIPKQKQVTVTYLPAAQGKIWEMGRLSTAQRDAQMMLWGGAFLGIALCFGVIIGVMENRCRYQSRLLREGVAVRAWACGGRVAPNGGYYFLDYAYRVGEEEHLETTSVTKKRYEQLTTGNPYFTVFYDTRNPAVSLPYFHIDTARLMNVAP